MNAENIAIGYVRQSDKDSSANSIASQKRRVESYCETYKLQLLQIFVDDGKSGWTFDRPGFKDLERYCKQNPKVRYLIVPHFDRFSRTDPIDAMAKERHFREKLGIKVLQITEPPDIDTNDPIFGLIRFIQAFSSNQERRRIVERAIHGMYDRLSQGYYCGMAPYGYVNQRDMNGESIIAINEVQAIAVRAMFKAHADGALYPQILKIGRDHGWKNKGNGSVQRLLSNPLYAGMVRVPAYKGKPSVIVKAKHPPIVSEGAYWRSQELLGKGQHYVKHLKDEVFLRGILRCNQCGRLMTAGNSKGKYKYYWYYLCVDHKENFSAIKCHDQFQEILANLSLQGKALAYIKAKTSEKIRLYLRDKDRNLVTAKAQLSNTMETIAYTQERYLTQPDISKDVYKKVMTTLKVQESNLQAKVAELSFSAQEIWDKHSFILSNIEDLQQTFNRFSIVHKQRFIRRVFDNSLSYADGSYRTPFINNLFSHNLVSLNEKGLLLIEQPIRKIGESLHCARDEIRTHTPVKALPPQSSASTNFATHALRIFPVRGCKCRDFLEFSPFSIQRPTTSTP